jgi:hypothetical protein
VLEQRKSRRFDLKLPIEVLRNGSAPLFESGETKNLSSSGVLFSSNAAVHPGDVLDYVIVFPNSTSNTAVRLRCKGKVVRRTPESELAATLERWEFERASRLKPV